MTGDLFHIGHLRAIKQCAKYGLVFVGLLTNRALKGYKPPTIIPYWERKELIDSIKGVYKVVPQHSLNMKNNLLAYNINLVASGDGFEPAELEAIKEAKCEPLEINYYPYQSTTKIREKILTIYGKSDKQKM